MRSIAIPTTGEVRVTYLLELLLKLLQFMLLLCHYFAVDLVRFDKFDRWSTA